MTKPTPQPSSKLDQLIGLLQVPDGASMEAMIAATGWLPHSVRGAMAGAVRKRGFKVQSEKTEAGRRWRIVGEEGAQ